LDYIAVVNKLHQSSHTEASWGFILQRHKAASALHSISNCLNVSCSPPEYNSISLLLEPPTANEHQSLKLCVWDMGWARPPFYIPGEKKLGPSNEEGIPGIS
jgi:hypothetical protein